MDCISARTDGTIGGAAATSAQLRTQTQTNVKVPFCSVILAVVSNLEGPKLLKLDLWHTISDMRFSASKTERRSVDDQGSIPRRDKYRLLYGNIVKIIWLVICDRRRREASCYVLVANT